MRIKLVNLNTWFGGLKLWDNIVAYLKAEQPDILFLQEASEDTVNSIQSLLPLPFAEHELEYNERKERGTNEMRNAIISKFPLTDKKVLWLQGDGPILADGLNPELYPTFPRHLLHCQAMINSQLYNLLTLQGVWAKDHHETDGQRQMAQKIYDYTKDKPNIIMAGDFNVNENTSGIQLIEQKLVNIFRGERTTSFNMKQKTSPGYATAVVDFVFTSPNIKVSDHHTSTADVSDHQSQVVVFDL